MERPFFVNCNLLYYKSLQWRAFAHGDLDSGQVFDEGGNEIGNIRDELEY